MRTYFGCVGFYEKMSGIFCRGWLRKAVYARRAEFIVSCIARMDYRVLASMRETKGMEMDTRLFLLICCKKNTMDRLVHAYLNPFRTRSDFLY